jgi:hypothetical protein
MCQQQNVEHHANEDEAYEELEAEHILATNRCT